MKIENAIVLVTGANRGLGRALVEEALRKGAKQVQLATSWRSLAAQVHEIRRSWQLKS
jgi:NAD(P)-dependent dehydrogenase (short-subunit alcohol dehydrogenase family)